MQTKIRWGRVVLGLLLLLLMVEIVLIVPRWISRVETDQDAPKASEKSENPVDSKTEQVLDGVHSLEAQGGMKEWELWSKTATCPKNQGLWKIEKVTIHFFKENQPAFYVDGQRGEIREDHKDLIVEGNVVIRAARGHRFETEKVNYNSELKTLQSPTPVRMTGTPESTGGEPFRLQGKEMVTDLTTQLIQVKGKVRSQKSLKGGRKMFIQSERAEFSGLKSYARFSGNVIIDVDTTRITGPEAEFKYKPNTDDVESLSVRGGVRMSDLDRWATADSVLFELDVERYIFEGSPKLVQSGDELIGDKIVVSKGGKEVEIFNAKAKVDKQRVNQNQ